MLILNPTASHKSEEILVSEDPAEREIGGTDIKWAAIKYIFFFF